MFKQLAASPQKTDDTSKPEHHPSSQSPRNETKIDLLITAILFIVALGARLWRISQPSVLLYDEIYFAKHAIHYHFYTQYFDIHPPLTKMILALAAYVGGYDGREFEFRFDNEMSEAFPVYMYMRAIHAVFGAAIIPLGYMILRQMRHSLAASLLGSLMLLMDIGLLVASRYILMDCFMLAFSLSAVYTWTRFLQARHHPFTKPWWLWQCLTGVLLGCSAASKLIGAFTVMLIAGATLWDLYELANPKRGQSFVDLCRHFVARAVSLGGMALIVYVAVFYVHCLFITEAGPDDQNYTPQFQSSLAGGKYYRDAKQFSYASPVLLNNLYSNTILRVAARVDTLEERATTFLEPGPWSEWHLVPKNGGGSGKSKRAGPAMHGDVVQIYNIKTKKMVLIKDANLPFMETLMADAKTVKRHREATYFVLDFDRPHTKAPLSSIDTRFRLASHKYPGVYLKAWRKTRYTLNSTLEVVGTRDYNELYLWWIVDDFMESEKAPTTRAKIDLSLHGAFWRKFSEMHWLMFRENANLGDEHIFQSLPSGWPFLQTIGVGMYRYQGQQIHILGNLAVYYVAFGGLSVLACSILYTLYQWRRGTLVMDRPTRRLLVTGGFLLAGWTLNYVPFLVMSRVLYFHHYLTGLAFSCLATAHVFDYVSEKWLLHNHNLSWALAVAMCSVFAKVTWTFLPVVYGFKLTRQEVESLRWVPAWGLLTWEEPGK